MKFTLKDYQDDAVKDVLVNLKKAQRRGHDADDLALETADGQRIPFQILTNSRIDPSSERIMTNTARITPSTARHNIDQQERYPCHG